MLRADVSVRLCSIVRLFASVVRACRRCTGRCVLRHAFLLSAQPGIVRWLFSYCLAYCFVYFDGVCVDVFDDFVVIVVSGVLCEPYACEVLSVCAAECCSDVR